LRIVSFQRTLNDVLIVVGFYFLMEETGLRKPEVKMASRISVRDVNVR
jgi:hypothetical protein